MTAELEWDSCDSAKSSQSLADGRILGKVLYAHDLAVGEHGRFKEEAVITVNKDNVESVINFPLYKFMNKESKHLGSCWGLSWIFSKAYSDVAHYLSAIVINIQNDVANKDFQSR